MPSQTPKPVERPASTPRRSAITDVDALFDALSLPEAYRAPARAAAQTFGLRVPAHYLEQMRAGDVHDPLLRQVLPLDAELRPARHAPLDAVGDSASSLGSGVLHKYRGRALLVTTGACAVHCRYCFRRHFDYAGNHAGGSQERAALQAIADDPSITEVILSGGDPLSLTNARLARLMTGVDAIEHVTTLRLHSRTPVVAPERVDAGLIECLSARRVRCVVVVHANHPREISSPVAEALASLAATGATLLNQAVLLAGVNDDADTLAELSKRVFTARTLPYYLHLLDPVAGTGHFSVAERRARRLIKALRARLPGYLVPRLAREAAGEPAKRVLAG